MLVAGRRERVAAEHIQIWNIVGPAIRIQHAFFWIDAHARRANLVNRSAQRVAPRAAVRVGRSWTSRESSRAAASHARDDFSSGFSEKLLGSLLKIGDQLPVIVGMREMDFQNRNSPVVLHFRQ